MDEVSSRTFGTLLLNNLAFVEEADDADVSAEATLDAAPTADDVEEDGGCFNDLERGLPRAKLPPLDTPKHWDELQDEGLESEDTVTEVELASAVVVKVPGAACCCKRKSIRGIIHANRKKDTSTPTPTGLSENGCVYNPFFFVSSIH